jgi:hypothetical protein
MTRQMIELLVAAATGILQGRPRGWEQPARIGEAIGGPPASAPRQNERDRGTPVE